MQCLLNQLARVEPTLAPHPVYSTIQAGDKKTLPDGGGIGNQELHVREAEHTPVAHS